MRVIRLAVIAFIAAVSTSARGDAIPHLMKKIKGATIYSTIKAFASASKEKYYVSKNGEIIFKPVSGYDKGTGFEYGYSKDRCVTLGYKFRYGGRIVWGKRRSCGKFIVRVSSLFLYTNEIDNNGLGVITKTKGIMRLDFDKYARRCKISHHYRMAGPEGTSSFQRNGVCVVKRGRNVKKNVYTFNQQVGCCIKYYRKMRKTCVGMGIPSNQCSASRAKCIKLVRAGGKYCQ